MDWIFTHDNPGWTVFPDPYLCQMGIDAMANKMEPEESSKAPAKQLAGFIAKFDARIAKLTRAARTRLKKRLPTAVELVYDNYNALAIGYGPSEKSSEAIISLAVYPRNVNLYFLWGAGLPDPTGVLQGSGNQGRFVVIEDASRIADPEIEFLMSAAEAASKSTFPTSGRSYTIIKSVSAKQRPRRPN